MDLPEWLTLWWFSTVYSDQNNVWYVSNYAWGNYDLVGPYQSHASIFLVLELN